MKDQCRVTHNYNLAEMSKKMLKKVILAATFMCLSQAAFANNTIIEMETTAGTIEIELYNEQAPISTKNFTHYVKSGFYKDTIFHRAIPKFMIQGGGFDIAMNEKENNRAPIQNESTNGLSNKRGTLAMARTNDPNSARSQFFINVEDNTFLDRSAKNAGYAVFGEVKKGMPIVDKISQMATRNVGMHQNVPYSPIQILSVDIKTAPVVNEQKKK